MPTQEFLAQFDALKARTIFCFWTGDEIMSENRLKALWTIFKNTGCPIVFITKDTIQEWVKADAPLHPAFPYLSSTHKADYLRCYLMYHYGGGYTDIKCTTSRWGVFFESLEKSDRQVLGYQELAHGIPHVTGELGDRIRASHRELIGLCAFIFKRACPLAEVWLSRTNDLLDSKLAALQQSPGQHPLDQTGVVLPDGRKSSYPLRWAEMLGEIFHPLIFEERAQLLQAPIEPIFSAYR